MQQALIRERGRSMKTAHFRCGDWRRLIATLGGLIALFPGAEDRGQKGVECGPGMDSGRDFLHANGGEIE